MVIFCVLVGWRSLQRLGKPIEVGELLNNIYEKAVAMEADAVVNLQINDTQRFESGLLVPGINISGLAIKRN